MVASLFSRHQDGNGRRFAEMERIGNRSGRETFNDSERLPGGGGWEEEPAPEIQNPEIQILCRLTCRFGNRADM